MRFTVLVLYRNVDDLKGKTGSERKKWMTPEYSPCALQR